MTQDAGVDLRELIPARRAKLELRAETLSRQLQEVRDELEELTVAERVAHRLAEQMRAESEPAVTSPAGQVAGRAVLAVPPRERGMDETVLPADYQRIMDVVRRADGPDDDPDHPVVITGYKAAPSPSRQRRSRSTS